MAKQPVSVPVPTSDVPGSFQLPDIFKAAPDPLKPRYIPPYITFAHNKRADEFKRIVDAFGLVDEGTMILVESNKLTKLDVLKASILQYFQFWTINDGNGKVTDVAWEELPKPWKENVEAVLVVYDGDRLVPANVQFRTTKCPAAMALSKALKECQTPEWAAKSPAHKETLALQQPFCRFYGEITLSSPKTGGSGNVYRATSCSIKPTGVAEWRVLKAFQDDAEAATKAMNDAAARFTSQYNFFKNFKRQG